MSVLTTKLQVGTAVAAVAAAAAFTPTVAHAAPSLAPFTLGVGNSAELLVDPVVIVDTPGTPGSNKSAAANASSPSQVIQTFISGFVLSAQNGLQSVVQFFGTFVYGGLAFTGLVAGAFGLTSIANGFDNAANNVAKAIKIGPYSTSA
ncbi:hypothetical protein [Mycolicibacterium vinylchloridicum]|uniref:hypothetical protein n=1 Tax=Mycolicibacterium vinylchloridicum TaxID=2736928 RepID=UPI0015C82FE5|nr:hypothetical protein [Mycolicibacterium vinylchloridicum]